MFHNPSPSSTVKSITVTSILGHQLQSYLDFCYHDLNTIQNPLGEEWTYFSLHVTVCQSPKAAFRGIGLLYFILAHHRPLLRGARGDDQSKNLEAGIEAESMDEYCLLDCSHGFLGLLSHPSQECLPRGGTVHNRLGLLTQSLIMKIFPQTCMQANLMDRILQLRFSLPK